MSAYLFFEGTIALPKTGRVTQLRAAVPERIAGTQVESEEAKFFFGELFELTGLPRGAYRLSFLQRRLAACLRFLQVHEVGPAIAKLRQSPEARMEILNAVLLGVTDFYRDQDVFEQTRKVLSDAWRLAQGKIRVWSAACSDGQELYSMASLMAEMGFLPQAELCGTDFRADAIHRAQAGRYRHEEMERLPERVRAAHFRRDGMGAFIRQDLQDVIRWKQADLFAGAESGPWHLILWRNMAIYLEREAAYPVWQSLVAELRPGGYLMVGKADYPPPGLGLIRVAPCLYQKKGKHGK
ncbi:CheR family methyltransferase [Prosthecobacter dejongeii]|uniref:Chemotaxis methyl-accepting protein methylase n=1 Tax=Prosthecobacter dejongeii TaxID=48465 RepID=A0A7W7YIM6_9BACT|nr:CheR family methyltransferase [Prosthecobacter dejongeii]MBB5036839.1 chemotaxis methyl-accepting protein methylase [Prosthecobacter dejongeii]